MKKVNRFWRDLPVSSKLASLSSLLLIAIVLVLSFISISRERKSFQQELESQATLMMQTLPLTMRDQLYLLELDELADIAHVVSNNKEVTLLKIYDANGRLLVDAALPGPVFAQITDEQGEKLIETAADEIIFDWQVDQLVVGRSVWLGNQRVGALLLGLSTESLNDKISNLTYQGILIAIGALVIGMGFAIVFAQQITNPISQLTKAASEMAGGDLKTRVKLTSDDEVGQLGSAFNQMAEAIEKRDGELREQAAGLEKTVEERTGELRNTVQALIKANADLDIARRDAEEATRLKSQFLASMSHELRTPLNAIMGFSQLLLMGTAGPVNEKQQERLGRILRNAQSLLDLINNLLDLAKIEAGRTELFEKPFVVREWIDDIHRQLETLAQQKKLAFTVNYDETMPGTIIADEARLRQVVVNLLSNAIKFTEKGQVTVCITNLADDQQWMIEVSDTGIGIPSHAQEYIFDEFRQVDGSAQRQYGGTGLGLAITHNLVMMMGGTITLKSKVDEGTTFTLRFPLRTEETLINMADAEE